MDKSCRRILFCNFCQNNKGNLSASILAYAGGLVPFLLSTTIKQSSIPTPGSTPHAAGAQPQVRLPSLPAIPTMILTPVLLLVFMLMAIFFSHHLSSKAERLFSQKQALISTASRGDLTATWYSDNIVGQISAVTQVSKTQAAKFLISLDLSVAVPKSKNFNQIPNLFSVSSMLGNSASISLGTDPHNILVWPDRRGFFQNFS